VSEVPEKVRNYNADGIRLFRQGDYAHAKETFEAALALAPDDLSLRHNIAGCLERTGQSGKAEQMYLDCVRRDPNHADSRYALCVLLVRQGRRDDAVQMVHEWLARQPRNADAYAVDGWLWHQSGDLPRAQGRLQQALQIDPKNARAMTELGLVYESLHMPARALVLYERSLDTTPDQPELIDRVNRLRARGVSYPKPD
jgi:tetratricopeptide (TPR) repeat protein